MQVSSETTDGIKFQLDDVARTDVVGLPSLRQSHHRQFGGVVGRYLLPDGRDGFAVRNRIRPPRTTWFRPAR
jgi:hypothetical protein